MFAVEIESERAATTRVAANRFNKLLWCSPFSGLSPEMVCLQPMPLPSRFFSATSLVANAKIAYVCVCVGVGHTKQTPHIFARPRRN